MSDDTERRVSSRMTTGFQTDLPSVLRRLASLIAISATVLALAGPSSAEAEFDVVSFSNEAVDANGDPYLQAGGHPYAVVNKFELPIEFSSGIPLPDGQLKNLTVTLPTGFVGKPGDMPQCSADELSGANQGWGCPLSSQVGTVEIHTSLGDLGRYPVFNMTTDGKSPARFGFNAVTVTVFMNARVPVDGQRLKIETRNTSQALPLTGTTLTMWGVPASRDHDMERGFSQLTGRCNLMPTAPTPPCPANVPESGFLANGTSCGEPQETELEVTSWQEPDEVKSASYSAPPLAGCGSLRFDPELDVDLTERRADSPTGISVKLEQEQIDNPIGTVSAHLADAEVMLPEGMAVNPAVADGLATCSEAEFGLGEETEVQCPEASKLGTVRIVSPLLDVPLEGDVYQAAQGDNPFGSLLALYLAPQGPGMQLKLAGEVSPDPQTGQLTTTFRDNPQFPFESFELSLKDGPRAPLVTPPTCGRFEATAQMVPWSAADPDNPTADEIVTSTSELAIDNGPNGGPCPAGDPSQPGDPADLSDRPFEPELKAGMKNAVAGSFTPFTFQLKRQDGHQEILATEVTPPAGVTARLAGIPFCSEADAEQGSCGPESKVGQAITGAGAGPNPFYIQNGEVHLAGPYDPDGPGGEPEAPLSLVIEVPAVAGPFDLGEVVVRAATYVDPTTAQLRVVSDPIPQILEGIPLRIRDIRIRMDREAFTIAPTDCTETKVEATAYGSHGAQAELENRFQVGECASLGFKPKLTFQATGGKKATKRNAHPGLRANLKVPGADAYAEGAERGSQANIRRVQVTLPKGLFLDQASPALVDPCSRAEYEEGNCPASSKVGTAVAHTPLLDEPLKGPVYLRTGDNKLPDLVADLDGIVSIDLVGAVSQSKQRIRNTFRIVPDVPVSAFELRIQGGPKGLLVNSNTGKGLCGKKRRQVGVAMRAHNNRRHAYKTQMKARCPKAKKKGKAKKAKRAAKRAARR